MVVIDLNLAEVLVLPLQACRQLDCQRNLPPVVRQLEGEAVLVEIVGVGDLPVDAQALVVQHLHFQLVGLFHGQELRRDGRSPEGCGRSAAANLGLDQARGQQ